jgi:hypothetical protein
MAKRLQKTLLDYLVIAISPAMIIVLIDSLALFLISVFYRGGYEGRLEYVITLFVIGAVLIGRISIDEGRERAMLFAAPLGIAILLAICKFVEFKGALAPFSFFINCGLIALIWWSADKLTWDCTLIDEQEEDSGEGLLETIGLDKPDHDAIQREIAPLQEPPKQIEATTSRDDGPISWWDRFIERRRRPHAPGVWVVYFSLAALPLFGLGQLCIPKNNNDLDARQHAFQLLFVYTASGLGLLLSTSFLGLRRYLRQRRQEMPLQMVNLWLGVGVALIVGVMFAALLLPRPNAEYAISDLPFHVGSPDQHSSPNGMGPEGVEEEQPDARLEPKEDAKPDAPQSDQPGDSKSSSGSNDDGKSKSSRQQPSKSQQKAEKRGESGDAKTSEAAKKSPGEKSSPSKNKKQSADDKAKGKGGKPSDRDTDEADKKAKPSQGSGTTPVKPPKEAPEQRKSNATRPNDSPRTPSVPRISFPHALPSFSSLLKWILYLALAVLIAWAVWKNRKELLAALRDFRQMLADLWNRLFGGKPREAAAAAAEEAARQRPLPRFTDYQDPFATGAAARYPPAELVRYTFEALEAWARDTGHPRLPDQTPHEFARCLAAETSSLAADAGYLAELYCHVAYAHATPAAASVGRLALLWQAMRVAIAPRVSPAAK